MLVSKSHYFNLTTEKGRFVDFIEFLPYIGDDVQKLLKEFNGLLLSKGITKERYEQILIKEMPIYLNHFRNMKIQNPDKVIDDHVSAIFMSYVNNPNLNIMYRDAHYNGTWYALWGSIRQEGLEKIKEKCKKIRSDANWTRVCLSAVDEYFSSSFKKDKKNSIKSFINGWGFWHKNQATPNPNNELLPKN